MSREHRDIFTKDDVFITRLNGKQEMIVCPRSIFTSVAVEYAHDNDIKIMRICTCSDKCYEQD
jgi:hypothetical protein